MNTTLNKNTTLEFRTGLRTDVGRRRPHNEDALAAGNGLWVVCDGLGGAAAGEIASATAVETIINAGHDGVSSPEAFGAMIGAANHAVLGAGNASLSKRGMATTVTALAVLPGDRPRMMVANVGDSRTYLMRSNILMRVSVDHSVVQRLVDEGHITREEARIHPQSHIVTRVLGAESDLEVDVFVRDAQPGDRYLLASDGLTDMVSDQVIEDALIRYADPQACADALVELANQAGGRDNVSIIVVDITR